MSEASEEAVVAAYKSDPWVRLAPWICTIGLFVVWELAVRVLEVPYYILPAPTAVAYAAYEFAGGLLENSLQTLWTTLAGFGLAIAFGLALGLFIGWDRRIYAGLYPLMIGFNSIPKVAVVPILVLFMLKDKQQMLRWARRFLPRDISLIGRVWHDMDGQISNYVRGKVVEILIVWTVSFIVYKLLGLNYAVLLGAVTGFSVLVPWVGATLVTIPVAAVAYAQFGLGPQLAWTLIAYGVLQALDGNVLVPLIFSETNDLHPAAIIVAVMFFGGVWGFWGVFFAIPLATLVNAVIKAWPASDNPREAAQPPPTAHNPLQSADRTTDHPTTGGESPS